MTGPILVLGAAGQLGQELMVLAAERAENVVGTSAVDLDVRDASAIAASLAKYRPRLIVNCAAYTAVDKAESEPELAAAVNATAPGVIAKAAASRGIPVLQISTDYVFDGTKSTAYDEDDPVAPLNVYGRTKLDGEIAVREATERHVILRTSWLFGQYGSNFLKTMLRAAQELPRLRVVADQIGCPTATTDLAHAILAVDAKLVMTQETNGTYHFAGPCTTTWHEFAELIVNLQSQETGRRPPIEAIRAADYLTSARRPTNSSLNSDRFLTTFGYRARPWQQRTHETMTRLFSERVLGNRASQEP